MNHLKTETSPYLLQHADNPVHWYPWGDEAFEAARKQDKPILLSIGYAACHWCHVMAHESFEHQPTADLMNEHFINIKVDREERPDVDRIYMAALIAMTQSGGWPLTAFLTPAGKPFYAGTYFPPQPRYQMPSFDQVLLSMSDHWNNNRQQVMDSAEGITKAIAQRPAAGTASAILPDDLIESATRAMASQFDSTWGGFNEAPKFPQPMTLEFLLRSYMKTGDPKTRHMVEHSLTMMAQGGMYDQIGGGFARYSTDREWLVPHFEKMLYDNSQLARIYLHAFQVTHNPLYKKVVEETLDYVKREMTHPAGGFYSSQDADSEGVEGKFYVWSAAELESVLGDDFKPFSIYYDIAPQGNWEGKNIPNMSRSHTENAAILKLDPADLADLIKRSKQKLYDVRSQRIWPGLDDKVLTSWNGMMLAAFAEAGRVLDRPDYTLIAIQNGEFLRMALRTADGRLLRTWKDVPNSHGNGEAKFNGYLEDYAFLADGLLALYESTFDERWFEWMLELVNIVTQHFSDDKNSGFFDTSDDHEELIFRPKELQDNAIPCGNSTMALVLARLALLTGDGQTAQMAEKMVGAMTEMLEQYPLGFGQWLNTAAQIMGNGREIAIVHRGDLNSAKELIEMAQKNYRPYDVIAVGTSNSAIPLLHNRPMISDQPSAYVCRNFACQLPVTSPMALEKQLLDDGSL
ncbi:MAG: hypothetical protein ACI9EW_002815 [Cellvibrionaceae bacterium]|jgi:uncharacterized protein YyaL (SSP411 family)